jgi:hypothetical protein
VRVEFAVQSQRKIVDAIAARYQHNRGYGQPARQTNFCGLEQRAESGRRSPESRANEAANT